MPGPLAFWFVSLELPLEVGSVGIRPLAFEELVLVPRADKFHASYREYVSTCPMLFSVQPVA